MIDTYRSLRTFIAQAEAMQCRCMTKESMNKQQIGARPLRRFLLNQLSRCRTKRWRIWRKNLVYELALTPRVHLSKVRPPNANADTDSRLLGAREGLAMDGPPSRFNVQDVINGACCIRRRYLSWGTVAFFVRRVIL